MENLGADDFSQGAGLEGCLDSSVRSNTDSPVSSGATARSESEDSGVDVSGAVVLDAQGGTESTEDTFLEPSSDNTDDDDGRPDSSSSAFSLPSVSSSSCLSVCSATEDKRYPSTGPGFLVEQALQRTDFSRRRMLRRDPSVLEGRGSIKASPYYATSSPTEPLTLGPRAGQGSDRLESKSPDPVVSEGRAAEVDSTGHMLQLPTLTSQSKAEPPKDGGPTWGGLSPGLLYLEQVCRMLEEIARLQMFNRMLRVEVDALWHQSATVEDDQENYTEVDTVKLPVSQRQKVLRFSDQNSTTPRDHSGSCRRSASDAQVLTHHRRKSRLLKVKAHKSLEALEEELGGGTEPPVTDDGRKRTKTLKLKIGSLGKNEKLKPNKGITSPQSPVPRKSGRMRHLLGWRRKTTSL